MSDEYIAQMMVDELRESCPGETGCHGCQSWCPKCGSVGHVCDDPGCDAHRRDTDVLRDLVDMKNGMARVAEDCRRMEKLMFGSAEDKVRDLRWQLKQAATRFEGCEKEIGELQDELREIRAPGSRLVPRKEGSKFIPRDR